LVATLGKLYHIEILHKHCKPIIKAYNQFTMPLPKMPEELKPPAYTPEQFYTTSDWGIKSGLTLLQFTNLWLSAQEKHTDRKAHNFEHAVHVLGNAAELADDYEAVFPDESSLNRKVLFAAALWHDVAPSETGSAQLFAEQAASFGYSLGESAMVETAILTTAEQLQPGTREEKILAIADYLRDLGLHSIEAVEHRADEFRDEAKAEQGPAFDEVVYRSGNFQRLANYVTKNLSLDGFERKMLTAAQDTVRRMIIDWAKEQHEDLPEFVRRLGGSAIELFNDHFKKSSE
jgi:HD superfamily phosphodiesterase